VDDQQHHEGGEARQHQHAHEEVVQQRPASGHGHGDEPQPDDSEHVDVWIFALHTAEDPDLYDPLDLDQWEFRVMPHRQLLATGQVSAGLSFFTRHGVSPVAYSELRAAVKAAREANR
jgi:hypothetical protein